MLITFKSPVASDTTYVGPIGERFLGMMGRAKSAPGAMMAEDVPGALTSLKRELKRLEDEERAARQEGEAAKPDGSGAGDRESSERPVSVSQRAYPLIQLLEKSAEAECEVTWE